MENPRPMVVDDAIRPVTSGLESSWNSGTMYKRAPPITPVLKPCRMLPSAAPAAILRPGLLREGLAGGIVIAVEEWRRRSEMMDCDAAFIGARHAAFRGQKMLIKAIGWQNQKMLIKAIGWQNQPTSSRKSESS